MSKRNELLQMILDMSESQVDLLYQNLSSSSEQTWQDQSSPTRIKIDQDLYIFKQLDRSKKWWVRLRIKTDGKSVIHRFSTKKEDVEEARVIAIEERLKRLGQAEVGFTYGTSTKQLFKTAAQLYIEQLESLKGTKKERTTHPGYIQLLNDHILPCFGNRNLKEIRSDDIFDFLNFITSVSSLTRIRMQRTVLEGVFTIAVTKNIISKNDVPLFPKIRNVDYDEPDAVWEPIVDEDLKLMRGSFDSFIEAGVKKQTKVYREAAKHYFEFCLSTGVRPGKEPKSIIFKNIIKRKDKKSGKDYYVAKITDGKVNSETKVRTIVLENEAVSAIEHAFKCLSGVEQLHSIDHLKLMHPDEPVFKSITYQKFPPYGDILNKKQFFGFIKKELKNQDYVSYCMRHTYINKKLAADVPFNAIAENCGTSYAMIENHYKRVKDMIEAPEHARDNIGGERPRSLTESLLNRHGNKSKDEIIRERERINSPEMRAKADKFTKSILKNEDCK